MSAPITLNDITIHPVVEQEGPFFTAKEFFPTLSSELFDENRSWLVPQFIDPAGGVMLITSIGRRVRSGTCSAAIASRKHLAPPASQ
jgi:hypothetical protein